MNISNSINPDLTVLMTVFNGTRFLASSIKSILNQTYESFEFLIIDDASTDDSIQLIESFNDTRIKLVRNPENIGQARSLNKGIEIAQCPFIARLDQDDVSTPDRLEKQIEYMKKNPDITFTGTWMDIINHEGIKLGTWRGNINSYSDLVFSLLKCITPVYHPTAMFKRKCVIDMGGYNPDLAPSEDYDLWVRLALAGYKAHVIPESLCLYRVHETQQSQDRNDLQKKNANKSQARMISFFNNEYPPDILILYLMNDKLLWPNISSFNKARHLASGLKNLFDNIIRKLNMVGNEYLNFKKLFFHHALEVACKGAILSNNKESFMLFLLALRYFSFSNIRLFLRYPFTLLPGPLRNYIRPLAKTTIP